MREENEANAQIAVEEVAVSEPAANPSAAKSKATFTRQQWGLMLLLAAINFTHILDFVIVMPLGDQLRQQLQISPRQFGIIVSAYGLAAMIVGIVSSSVVDLFDRKFILISTFGGFTLATFYCGVAPNYTHLLIARSLAGLFGGLAASSVMAVIGDVFSDGQRGRAIGIVTSSFAVASTIGLPIGLWLSIQFGNWNAPFIAIGVLGVCVWVLAAACLPSLTSHRTGIAVNPLRQFATVVQHPNHLWSFAFMLATIFGTFIVVPYIAPYLQANCGREPADLPVIYCDRWVVHVGVDELGGLGNGSLWSQADVPDLCWRRGGDDVDHYELALRVAVRRRCGHVFLHGLSQRTHHSGSDDDAASVESAAARSVHELEHRCFAFRDRGGAVDHRFDRR